MQYITTFWSDFLPGTPVFHTRSSARNESASHLRCMCVCSMERLFDLMCGGVKLMLCTANSAEEVITGTVAHLNGLVEILRQIPSGSRSYEQRRISALQLVEASKCKVIATYYADHWTPALVDMLRTEMLTFFSDCRVKVQSQPATVTVAPSHAAYTCCALCTYGCACKLGAAPGFRLPERRYSGRCCANPVAQASKERRVAGRLGQVRGRQ